MTNQIKSEIELCKIVISYLISNGYEIYQEVTAVHGRIDILAIKNGFQWAIEVKRSSGFDLFKQALRWPKYCHFTSIASPNVPRIDNRQLLRDSGIGILQIGLTGVMEYRKPIFNEKAAGLVVFEEQKTQSKAGTRHSGYYLPTREQLKKVRMHIRNIDSEASNAD